MKHSGRQNNKMHIHCKSKVVYLKVQFKNVKPKTSDMYRLYGKDLSFHN